MTEEVQNLAEVESAQATEATAAPEAVEAAPESAEQTPEQKAEEKRFTQAELDAIISKRLAKEQRKWDREQRQRAQQAPVAAPAEPPTADKFDSPEAYAEALAEQKAAELLAKREAERQQAELLESYHEREEEARNKYDDFEQVAYNPRLPITQVMAQTIQASEIGPEIAYYLGSNPKDADRIARLSPFLQAKEIGKIEAKLTDNPPTKTTSRAPAPIAPVTPRGGSARVLDTTDPRSVKEMTTSEWIEAERQRQIRNWEARNRIR
jgi:hypothetical protein